MVQRTALTCALVLTACSVTSGDTSRNPYVPLAVLEADPASRLVIPGAEVIRRIGHERLDNITGPVPSVFGAVYGVQGGTHDTFAFYDRELLNLGWQRQPTSSLSSGETRSWSWCKPQINFRLAVFDPKRYDRVGIQGGGRYQTVYDARLIATGPLPCPEPIRTLPPP
jgi:hypothetical protein